MTQAVTSKIIFEILNQVIQTPQYQIFIWLIAIDIFTGVGKAVRLRKLDSAISTNGMIRHLLVVLIVTLFNLYGRILGFEPLAGALGYFYIASYGISILENADAMGLHLPSWMTKYFNRMRDDYDDKLDYKAKQNSEKE